MVPLCCQEESLQLEEDNRVRVMDCCEEHAESVAAARSRYLAALKANNELRRQQKAVVSSNAERLAEAKAAYAEQTLELQQEQVEKLQEARQEHQVCSFSGATGNSFHREDT
jgi:uncharacterized damage-inducible protein DinB